jgi:hypothetical protein
MLPLFVTGVVDNLPPISLTPVANLPPVSTTPGVAKFIANVAEYFREFCKNLK